MLIFPENLPGLAYSQIRRQKFNVSVQTHQSGAEVRLPYWSEPLLEWDLSFNLLRSGFRKGRAWQELETVQGLYYAVGGSRLGFAFRDKDDCRRSRTGLGTTDGTATAYDLTVYQGGVDGPSGPYLAGPYHIGVLDTLQPFNLYIDGSADAVDVSDPVYGYTLDTSKPVKQQLVFNSAPPAGHVITADFSFRYYVRFSADALDFEKFLHGMWSVKKITLMSLRF